jgi:hypothetical protein
LSRSLAQCALVCCLALAPLCVAPAAHADPPAAPPAGAPAEAPAPPPATPPVASPGGGFDLSGGIYLFEYLPRLDGAKEKFEIYAFVLNLDAATADERYGLHVQARARDSKLRSYFVSTTWFQEAYAWAKTPAGDLHVGKFYRRVGILWDDSFFGNVQYFNGLKLNPDYGLELVGRRALGRGFSADYSAQYFVNNDQVAGSLPGRDVESDPDATLRQTATGRVVPTWELAGGGSLALGLSALSGRIDRTVGESFRLSQAAADLTLTRDAWIAYAELLRQRGEKDDAAHPLSRPGYDDATYMLAGARWQALPWLNARLNYSRADYDGQDAVETEVVPGLVIALRDDVHLIVEYDHWLIRPRGGRDQFIDKSFELVLHYTF